MKVKYLCLLLIVAFGISSCKEASKEPVFVMDDYGVIQKLNPDEKNVYLVFTAHYSTDDEGFFENFDGVIPVLDTLKSREVKGSFFPTGNCFRVDKYRPALQRILDEGHYLSAHSNHHLLLCSYDNRDSTLVSLDSLQTDIKGMEAELELLGLKKEQYHFMIPPYEWYNKFSADALKDMGYTLLNPTEGLETSMDWMGKEADNYTSAEQLVQNIFDYEKQYSLNGCIILVHAMNYPSRSDEDRVYTHLGSIIDRLRDLGYGFESFKSLTL